MNTANDSTAETKAHIHRVNELLKVEHVEQEKWKITLLEGNFVVGTGKGHSPVWFIRHGNENRDQIEELIAKHNASIERAVKQQREKSLG